jgi:hypothetical protein
MGSQTLVRMTAPPVRLKWLRTTYATTYWVRPSLTLFLMPTCGRVPLLGNVSSKMIQEAVKLVKKSLVDLFQQLEDKVDA